MPQAPEILEAYGQLQRFLGQATMEAVHAAVTQPWREVHLEITTSPDGKTGSVRVRVVPESGAVTDIPLTQPIVSAAHEIWKLRSSGITPNWGAMRLLIASEGQCTVNFDYAD
jgi:hypothetical protein